MRSTGGLLPLRVLVSYKSVASGKSKIKLKIHVLGNKALFLSIFLSLSITLCLSLQGSLSLSLSLSFVFFLFLRVTCKYGSHNSPLNTGNTRSHEIYGWSPALADLGVVQVCGTWGVRIKSPKCLGHMKQRARAVLGVVRVWPMGSPYEITQMPRSHEAPEQFTGPIRVKL